MKGRKESAKREKGRMDRTAAESNYLRRVCLCVCVRVGGYHARENEKKKKKKKKERGRTGDGFLLFDIITTFVFYLPYPFLVPRVIFSHFSLLLVLIYQIESFNHSRAQSRNQGLHLTSTF